MPAFAFGVAAFFSGSGFPEIRIQTQLNQFTDHNKGCKKIATFFTISNRYGLHLQTSSYDLPMLVSVYGIELCFIFIRQGFLVYSSTQNVHL